MLCFEDKEMIFRLIFLFRVSYNMYITKTISFSNVIYKSTMSIGCYLIGIKYPNKRIKRRPAAKLLPNLQHCSAN